MTEVDTLLSRKYKEMLGYYNIINDNNNTILTGDTTILSSLNVKNESIFNNSVSINTNLLVYGETYLHDITINSILYSNNFFINNNLISSSDINIKNNFYAAGSLNSNIIKASNSTITSDLYVSGITTINNNLYSNRIFAFNTSLSIISNKINIGTTNSLININGTGLFIINNNTAISSKSIILNNKRTDNGGDSGIEIYGLYGNGYIKTLPTADRFIIKAPRNSDYGFITTLNSNGDLIVNGYSIFKKALTINSTLNILGNTIYQNDVQINLNLFVSNITIIKNTVTMLGNINIGDDNRDGDYYYDDTEKDDFGDD